MEDLGSLDWPFLKQEAERVARLIAPEIGETPLYVVSLQDTDLGGNLGESSACTGVNLDLMLKRFVAWRGRGPAILFDQSAFTFADDFLGVVIHELAHILADDYLGKIKGDPQAESFFAEHSKALLCMAVSPVRQPMTSPVIDTHGIRWLRAALHARHRAAWSADCSVGVTQVVGYTADDFKIIKPLYLHAALLASNEYVRCASMTFAQFLELPLPKIQASPDTIFERKEIMTVESLLAEARAKQARKIDVFNRLAKQVAGGEFPTPEAIVAGCEMSGKSLDDFEAEVARLERRAALHVDAERGGQAQDDIAALSAKMQALEADFAVRLAEHQRHVAELSVQRDSAREVLAAAKAAQRELLQSATDADLLEKQEAITAELRRVSEQKKKAPKRADLLDREQALVAEREEVSRQLVLS